MNSKKTGEIPISRISEQSPSGIIVRYISIDEQVVTIDHAHRDNYYVFIFLESGAYRVCIDFDEYQLNGKSIAFIRPGQIHFAIEYKSVIGWLLAVDAALINFEYKDVFEKVPIHNSVMKLSEDVAQGLQSCISLLFRKIQTGCGITLQHALISSYIGLITEIYQNSSANLHEKRPVIIASQFKKLLSENYRFAKSPFQYASMLNLSPSYLNEVVKRITGFTVSEWIQNEIILQAKRLLFHTDMAIKEIANELGYEDYAYFTRLFTKVTGVSPTQFKANYRK